jgi:hypothetical protein
MFPLRNKLILIRRQERSYSKTPLKQSYQKVQREDGYA